MTSPDSWCLHSPAIPLQHLLQEAGLYRPRPPFLPNYKPQLFFNLAAPPQPPEWLLFGDLWDLASSTSPDLFNQRPHLMNPLNHKDLHSWLSQLLSCRKGRPSSLRFLSIQDFPPSHSFSHWDPKMDDISMHTINLGKFYCFFSLPFSFGTWPLVGFQTPFFSYQTGITNIRYFSFFSFCWCILILLIFF